MKTITQITVTYSDETTEVVFPVSTPVVPATDPVVEIDTKTESGVEETFVPATPEVVPTV